MDPFYRVALRAVVRCKYNLCFIFFAESLEFTTAELWSIVTHDKLRAAKEKQDVVF